MIISKKMTRNIYPRLTRNLTRHWSSTYKLSVQSSERLVESLLDIINMNPSSSTQRIKDSLEALDEVRDMGILAEQSPVHLYPKRTTVKN